MNRSELSLPEQVQLLRPTGDGALKYGYFDLAAAALLDLAIARRIRAVPRASRRYHNRRIEVIDPRPTGDTVLDHTLGILGARTRPWDVGRCLSRTAKGIVVVTALSLEARGVVRLVGRPGAARSHISVVDTDTSRAVAGLLNTALLYPETVVDPRMGALAEVFQRAGNPWTQDRPGSDAGVGAWWPDDLEDTADAVLHTVSAVTGIAT